jgi:hypothetical protein
MVSLEYFIALARLYSGHSWDTSFSNDLMPGKGMIPLRGDRGLKPEGFGDYWILVSVK